MSQRSEEPEKYQLKKVVRCEWKPEPLQPPAINSQLPQHHPLTRSAESILYSILSLEFWLSPEGQVREWVRHNGRLALVLTIPVFLVLPIITFGLWQLVSFLSAISSIAGKLIIIPFLIGLAVGVIYVAVQVLRSAFNK